MKTIKIFYLLLGIHKLVYGQLNPMGSTYFLNRYIENPAAAGRQSGWETNLAYKAQWTAIPNQPSMQHVTCTFGAGNKVGLGLAVARETFGVFNRNNAKLSYAYHVPLDDGQTFLDFGISGSLRNTRIDQQKVIAEPYDQVLMQYNQKPWSADGDVGLILRNNVVSFGASVSDLRKFLRHQTEGYADQPCLLFAIQGHLEKSDILFTPLLQYRQVLNFRSLWDAGMQTGFSNGKLNGSVIYHSTKSVTFSVGTDYRDALSLVAFYTSGTSDFRQYSNGEFEFAIRYVWR